MHLTPRDFLAQYGQCVTRTVEASQVSPYIIPANEDRYLLCFWMTNNQCSIMPKIEDPSLFTNDAFSQNTPAIYITHALYGAMVNLEWQIRVNSFGVVANVILIEGRMTPNKQVRKKGR